MVLRTLLKLWLSAAGGSFAGRLAGGCEGWHERCRRSGGHHRGECASDVLDVPGEGCVGRDEIVNGGVLLDGRVGEIVERRGHLLRLFHLCSLIGSEG